MNENFSSKYKKQRTNTIKRIPEKPVPVAEIMKDIKKGAADARHCCYDSVISGCVYINDQKHWDFINEVMSGFVHTNALHMDEYKTVT